MDVLLGGIPAGASVGNGIVGCVVVVVMRARSCPPLASR